MLCLLFTSLSLDVLSVYTLTDIDVGDTSSFSSALHYNTITYTNIYYTGLPILALP